MTGRRSPAPDARRAKTSPRRSARREPGELTHPDRIVFPDKRLAKADVASYYRAV